MHEKDAVNKDDHAVSSMVHCSYHANYGARTQNCVHHLAPKYPRPNIGPST